jgi:hypothetical protein
MQWPGWSFIGNVAQVLSLVAIVIAIAELVSRRRRMRSNHFLIDAYARRFDEVTGDEVNLFELSVTGTDDVQLWFVSFVGASYAATDDFRLSWRMNSGDVSKIAVRIENPESAWVLLAWISLEDRRYMWIRWYPLSGDALRVELNRQIIAHPLPKWWQRPWRTQFRAPVAPGLENTWGRHVRMRKREFDAGDSILPTLKLVDALGGGTIVPGRSAARAEEVPSPTKDATA